MSASSASSLGHITGVAQEVASSQRPSPAQVLKDMVSKLDHMNLTDHLLSESKDMVATGGYSDVFVGYIDSRHLRSPFSLQGRSVKVAIKRLRFCLENNEKLAKALARELGIWVKVEHNNVLPFLGFVLKNGYPSLISEWVDNGTVMDYLKSNIESDVANLALGIAEGLEYLHNLEIVHSDLKSGNILVSQSGEPLICDFGISRLLDSSDTFFISSSHDGNARGSLRWMAIELLTYGDGLDPKHSKESDVWAYGMTLQELISKKAPYSQYKNDFHVLKAIIAGELPLRPASMESESSQLLWSLCTSCWNKDPETRVTMSHVLRQLKDFIDSNHDVSLTLEDAPLPYHETLPIDFLTVVGHHHSDLVSVVPADIATTGSDYAPGREASLSRVSSSSSHNYEREPAAHALRPDAAQLTAQRIARLGTSPANVTPALKIHRALACSSSSNSAPAIMYDVTRAPAHDNILAPPPSSFLASLTRRSRAPPQPVPAHMLALPATRPFVPSLTLSLPSGHSGSSFPVSLPREWDINAVSMGATDSGHTDLTNLDVLHAVYTSLRTPVSRREWDTLGAGSSAQRRVAEAYSKRCERTGSQREWDAGVRRVDWLCGRTVLCGVECRPDGGCELVFAMPA